VTAAEMTEALVQINDRIALSPRADHTHAVTFFCECGNCLADDVSLTLDEHDEIRAREDLIFAPDHETGGSYRKPNLGHVTSRRPNTDVYESVWDEGWWRGSLIRGLDGIAVARRFS